MKGQPSKKLVLMVDPRLTGVDQPEKFCALPHNPKVGTSARNHNETASRTTFFNQAFMSPSLICLSNIANPTGIERMPKSGQKPRPFVPRSSEGFTFTVVQLDWFAGALRLRGCCTSLAGTALRRGDCGQSRSRTNNNPVTVVTVSCDRNKPPWAPP